MNSDILNNLQQSLHSETENFCFKSALSQRFIGIDQGTKTFSIVAVDKCENSLPTVVGALQYNLKNVGLSDNFTTGELITILQSHTMLLDWMQSLSACHTDSTFSLNHVARVVVLVEQMSIKNRHHKQFNTQFADALQNLVVMETCVVKMSSPHIHTKSGPMFRLGNEIVYTLQLQPITTDTSSTSMKDKQINNQIEQRQRLDYRKKKKMSADIFHYFLTSTETQQTTMQVRVTNRVQEYWSNTAVDKYDDL